MTDRSIFGLLGIVVVVALVIFLMTPQRPGSTSEKIRETVREQVQVTTDRLNNAFDAAKQDVQRQDR